MWSRISVTWTNSWKVLLLLILRFVTVSDIYKPKDNGINEQVFVSKSYDASSHFESVCKDVKRIYKNLTGKDLNVEGMVKRQEEQ